MVQFPLVTIEKFQGQCCYVTRKARHLIRGNLTVQIMQLRRSLWPQQDSESCLSAGKAYYFGAGEGKGHLPQHFDYFLLQLRFGFPSI